MKTLVIAECGSCHDNDLGRAIAMIEAASRAGAGVAKFQFWSSAKRLAERRRAPDYEAIYAKYQLPARWLGVLAAIAKAHDIGFMATCYLPEDIEVVAPFVNRFKVASFEAGDREFLDAHRDYMEWGHYPPDTAWKPRKDLIISTGMTDASGSSSFPVPIPYVPAGSLLLHCVSAYPCPLEQANLGVLRYENVFAGYSDHTRDVLTGAVAVAAGARILEVHFRLDDTDPANPDYATALTPGELAEYVRLVHKAEVMLGDGVKRPQPAEAAMLPYRVQR